MIRQDLLHIPAAPIAQQVCSMSYPSLMQYLRETAPALDALPGSGPHANFLQSQLCIYRAKVFCYHLIQKYIQGCMREGLPSHTSLNLFLKAAHHTERLHMPPVSMGSRRGLAGSQHHPLPAAEVQSVSQMREPHLSLRSPPCSGTPAIFTCQMTICWCHIAVQLLLLLYTHLLKLRVKT